MQEKIELKRGTKFRAEGGVQALFNAIFGTVGPRYGFFVCQECKEEVFCRRCWCPRCGFAWGATELLTPRNCVNYLRKKYRHSLEHMNSRLNLWTGLLVERIEMGVPIHNLWVEFYKRYRGKFRDAPKEAAFMSAAVYLLAQDRKTVYGGRYATKLTSLWWAMRGRAARRREEEYEGEK